MTAVDGVGPVPRGFIKTSATPIDGGFRLTVTSRHKTPNEKLTLVLAAEVLDKKTNKVGLVNLSVLTNQANLNGDKFVGQYVADVSYADIDKYLQAYNPNLKMNPGTTR